MPGQIYVERNKSRYLLIKLLDFKSLGKENYQNGSWEMEREEKMHKDKNVQKQVSPLQH